MLTGWESARERLEQLCSDPLNEIRELAEKAFEEWTILHESPYDSFGIEE